MAKTKTTGGFQIFGDRPGRRRIQLPTPKGGFLSEALPEDDLIRRALAGYFRSGETAQPSDGASSVEVHDGLCYVVLRNVRGILACYRVRHDGKLKRLRRMPKELAL